MIINYSKILGIAGSFTLGGLGLLFYFHPSLRTRVESKRLLILFVSLGTAIICLSFCMYGYMNTWRIFNIPENQNTFLDLRVISGSAESYAAGYDPGLNNPFDPYNRLFNYPRIWYILLASGINMGWTIPMGLILVGLFLAAVNFFPSRLDKTSSILMALVLFSPAVLLGVERGNVDLLFFFLAALSLLFVERSAPVTLATVLVGMLFKLYPIFGIGVLVSQDAKRSLKYILAGTLLTAFYFLLTWNDLLHVFEATQKGNDLSYGVNVILVFLASYLVGGSGWLKVLLYVLAFAMLVFAVAFGIRYRWQTEATDLRNRRAFWVGAGIYVGTFLLGYNWDYRFMFLLFTIPQLSEWLKTPKGPLSRVTLLVVATMLLAVWSFLWRLPTQGLHPWAEGLYFLDQAATWILFSGYSFLIGGRVFIQNVPGVRKMFHNFSKEAEARSASDKESALKR
jgi:hypothetical protein